MRCVTAILMVAAAVLANFGCSHAAKAASTPPRQLVKLDSTVLNLADADGNTYVRLGVTVALAPTPVLTPDQTTLVTSVANDTVVSVVSALTSASLQTPAGKIALKATLKNQIQSRLPGFRVDDLYFDEFLIQR